MRLREDVGSVLPELCNAGLNAIEADSPGAKASFYLNFIERMAPLLAVEEMTLALLLP